jgi:hypothetical protein
MLATSDRIDGHHGFQQVVFPRRWCSWQQSFALDALSESVVCVTDGPTDEEWVFEFFQSRMCSWLDRGNMSWLAPWYCCFCWVQDDMSEKKGTNPDEFVESPFARTSIGSATMSQGTVIDPSALSTTTITTPSSGSTTPVGLNCVCCYDGNLTGQGQHIPSVGDGKQNVVLQIGMMFNGEHITQLVIVVTAPFLTIHDQSTWDLYFDQSAYNNNSTLRAQVDALTLPVRHNFTQVGNSDSTTYAALIASTVTDPTKSFALQGLQQALGRSLYRLSATFADIYNPANIAPVQTIGCCVGCPTSDTQDCVRNACACDSVRDTTCAIVNMNYNNGSAPSSPGLGWFIDDLYWQYQVAGNQGTNGGVKYIPSVTLVDLSRLSSVVTPITAFQCCSNTLDDSRAYAPGTWEQLICVNQGRIHGNASCNGTIISECSLNMDQAACKTQCGPVPPFNTFPCSNIMTTYCDSKCNNSDGTVKSECLPGGNNTLRNLCGCYLSAQFFSNYYASLQSRVGGLPTAARKDCYYQDCGGALVLPDAVRAGTALPCPAVQQCITVTNIQNSGAINSDDITIIGNNVCNFTGGSGTGTGSTSTGTSSTGTGTGTSTASLSPSLIIGLIVGAVVLLAIVIGAIVASSRKKPAPPVVVAPVTAARPAYPYGTPYGTSPYGAYGSPYAATAARAPAAATPTFSTAPLTPPAYVPKV